MGYYPQESLYKPYKYHGYTVRGTPNCPLIQRSRSESEVIRIWDSAKWMRDEIIVQGRLSFSLLRVLASAKKGELG